MKYLNKIAVCGVILLVVGFGWGAFHKEISGDKIFKCNGVTISLNTKIIVDDGDYVVEGNILRLFEDPLELKNKDGKIIGTVGDNYDFITQDDHVVETEEGQIIMKGNVSLFGEHYTIVKNGEEVAYADYNMFDTNGTIKDMNDEIFSQYKSFLFMRDFEASFNINEILSEEEVLLIHAAYYSDKVFDK